MPAFYRSANARSQRRKCARSKKRCQLAAANNTDMIKTKFNPMNSNDISQLHVVFVSSRAQKIHSSLLYVLPHTPPGVPLFISPKVQGFPIFPARLSSFVSRCSLLGVVFQQLVHSKLCLENPRNGETGIPRFGGLAN